MTPAGIALLAVLGAPAQEPLAATDRTPLSVALVVPTGQRGPVSGTRLMARLDELIRSRTGFAVVSAGEEDAVRTIMLGNQPTTRLCEQALEVAGASPYLLQLRYDTPFETGEPATLTPFLIDLKRFAELRPQHSASELETRIFGEARAPEFSAKSAAPKDVASEAEVEAYLETLVDELLRPAFEANGYWAPYTEMTIEAPESGMVLRFDGRRVGETAEGTTRLTQVPRGEHVVTLEHPDYPTSEERFVTENDLSLQLTPTSYRVETNRTVRAVTFWTGVTASVAGAVLLGVAIAQDKSADACATTTGACAPPEWATLGDGGPPTAPLGYTLLGAGGGMALTTALTSDEELPWLSWIVGAAIAGASIGITVAAGPGS